MGVEGESKSAAVTSRSIPTLPPAVSYAPAKRLGSSYLVAIRPEAPDPRLCGPVANEA